MAIMVVALIVKGKLYKNDIDNGDGGVMGVIVLVMVVVLVVDGINGWKNCCKMAEKQRTYSFDKILNANKTSFDMKLNKGDSDE